MSSKGYRGFIPVVDDIDQKNLKNSTRANNKRKRRMNNKNNFRINTHMVHLTYSQIHIPPKYIEEYFIKKKYLFQYKFFSKQIL